MVCKDFHDNNVVSVVYTDCYADMRLIVLPDTTTPFSSDRQHLSYGACLEVRGEIIRTVLCCIVY